MIAGNVGINQTSPTSMLHVGSSTANADFVVANDVGKKGRGFDVETNEVFIVDKSKKAVHLGLADKRAIGNTILDLVAH